MRFGCAAAYVLIAALGASCGRQLEAPGPQCLHPCDLSQVVRISIGGGERAASIVATDACYGGVPDCTPSGGCSSADAYLRGGLAGDSGEMVCHVTATAFDGRVAEGDVVAHYVGSNCCAGYEFREFGLTLTFPPVDGG